MSSQGSSSVSVFSKTAFAPMLGDPLSKEVSEPSTSSTASAPEVASCLVDRRDMELAQEAASISGRQGDDEEEQVAVSYGDLQYLITPEDYTQITQEYDLEVVEPTDLERPHTPLDGYVTLSECYLQFGVFA